MAEHDAAEPIRALVRELTAVVEDQLGSLATERVVLQAERAEAEACRASVAETLARERAAMDELVVAQRAELDAEKAALEAEKKAMLPLHGVSAGDLLTLNVRGEVHTVTRGTLCLVERSLLAAMFSGRWDAALPRDAHGRIFLEFNPVLFGRILDYLSLRRLAPTTDVPRPAAPPEHEAQFAFLLDYLGLTDFVLRPPLGAQPLAQADEVFQAGPHYSLTEDGRVATETGGVRWGVVAGTTAVQHGVAEWVVRLRQGHHVMVGVAPLSALAIMRASATPYSAAGFHLRLHNSTLCSGPPFNHRGSVYGTALMQAAGGSRLTQKPSVMGEGSEISVRLDCAVGELSFACDGIDLGIAYRGLPLREPLTLVMLLLGRSCAELCSLHIL